MTFPYDVETLIKLVEERPCLWNKSEVYKKSKCIKRHRAWVEIYHCLEKKYDLLSIKEKKEVGMRIRTKWVNIKDAFIKTLKKNSACGPKKKYYIYANQLQFLLNSENESYSRPSDGFVPSDGLELKKEQEDHTSTGIIDNVDIEISGNDEKFFQSFIPYVKDMTENERIDLQMDLLMSIRRIKENRREDHSLKVTSQTWPTSYD